MISEGLDSSSYTPVVHIQHRRFTYPCSWVSHSSTKCHIASSGQYRIVGYFRGVLIFVIFVTIPGVTKFCTHEAFCLRRAVSVLHLVDSAPAISTGPCVDSRSKLRSEEAVDTSKMRDYYLSRLPRKAAVTVNGSAQMLISR